MTGRAARIEGESLVYYVSSKGKDDIKIFKDNMDRLYFINLLRQQNIKNNLKFFGYVLLPNQYSFLAETCTNVLSTSMHRINSDYINYFNRRHKHKKKLFKDRYSCFIIEKKNYLAKLSYYIHSLPIKEGLVKLPFRYKWSSLPGYINLEKREAWIDYDSILSMFDEESHEASLSYLRHIKIIQEKQIASPFENLRGNIILGSKEFKNEVLKKHHSNKIETHRDENIIARKIIELIIQSSSWSLLKVKEKKFNHTTLSRNATIYFLKKYTNLSNYQISTYFDSLKKSSISQMSRRFNLIKENSEAIKKITASFDKKIMQLISNKTSNE